MVVVLQWNDSTKIIWEMGKQKINRMIWAKCYFLRVLLLHIVLLISYAQGLLQDQYVGCFYDISPAPDVPASILTGNALTIEKCIAQCQAVNTTYVALQNGKACFCRENYGVQVPDATCNLACSGNAYEFCGGFDGHQSAYVVYTVCDIGSYGETCDKACHCKRESPCNRMTGNCPDGCHGNWSGTTCNLTSASQKYIGCYEDRVNNERYDTAFAYSRAMEKCIYCDGNGAWNKNNTLESCSQSCAENNYSYVGLEFSWQCFCGDKYDKYLSLNETTDCSLPCSGDNNTKCGGVYAFNAYSVCPIGTYGRSCVGRCHCLNDTRCIYRNGSCPSSKCSFGWTGTSCNKRDCSKNNGGCYLNETCSNNDLKYSTVSVCRCSDGFQRSNIWENCTDIDECNIPLCDPVSMICNNTVGSYNCSCKNGFQTYNATICMDIDECKQNICDNSTMECHNTPGSFQCRSTLECEKYNGIFSAGVIGFLIGVSVSVSVAFALLRICRQKYRFSDSFENKSSTSKAAELNVHGEPQRSAKHFIALNATSTDANTYEILEAGVSGVNETNLYAELNG